MLSRLTNRRTAKHSDDVRVGRRFPSAWWRSELVDLCDDEILVIADRHGADRAA